VKVGQAVEVVAFPALENFDRTLNDAVVRPIKPDEQVSPKTLDLGDASLSKQSCTLVRVSATLLDRTTNTTGQALELQLQQHVLAATLSDGLGKLPEIPVGSRLSVIGVLDNEVTPTPEFGDKVGRPQFLTSMSIRLRSPQDVAVLSGPPWWTWKRAVTLVGTLLTVLMVALMWVDLLRRRLERQQGAQIAFSRNVLERLEEERRRIAANLHDSLGQMLLVIKTQAIWATQGGPEEPGWREHLDEIGNTTSHAIEEVRRITHGLRPYQLDRLGLTQAIRTLVLRASETSSVVFASRVEDIDNVFNKDDEIHVYRIVQEAVNNILKHSGATEAAVVIKERTAAVSVSIRDNGRGFDLMQPPSDSHDVGYGLKGIAERVRILGGTWEVDSRPTAGTSTTIEIPLSISRHDTGLQSSNR
jgi:signal transduction histidine kinase